MDQHWRYYQVKVLVAQSCLTLCNPKDCSPPGSYVHGILQARILEWVAVSFSRGSSWPRDQTWVSCTAGRFFTTWAPREATREDTILSEISQSETNAMWSLQGSWLESPRDGGAWRAAGHGVAKSQTRLSDFTFTFHFHALEKAMATHSSVLAWRTPWTEEPGGLQSMGSLRVRHDWATSLWLFTFMHWRRQRHPTPVVLPGKAHGRRSLVGCSPWGR